MCPHPTSHLVDRVVIRKNLHTIYSRGYHSYVLQILPLRYVKVTILSSSMTSIFMFQSPGLHISQVYEILISPSKQNAIFGAISLPLTQKSSF